MERIVLVLLMTSASAMASGPREICGVDDRFQSATDFKQSRFWAQRNASEECGWKESKKAVRVSVWRERHSDGQDCVHDSIDFSCTGGSMMHVPVNQSCADFACK